MKRRAVLIGGNGYIGLRLAHALNKVGVEVLSVGRRYTADVVEDISDPSLKTEVLAERLMPASIIVHLAASPQTPKSTVWRDVVGSARGVLNLVEAMKIRSSDIYLFYFGSVARYAHPIFRSAYGNAKREAYRLFMESGLMDAWVIPSLVYGNNPRMQRNLTRLSTYLDHYPQVLDGFKLHCIHVDLLAAQVADTIVNLSPGELIIDHESLTLRELYSVCDVSLNEMIIRPMRTRLTLEFLRHLLSGEKRLSLFFLLAMLSGSRVQRHWNHYLSTSYENAPL